MRKGCVYLVGAGPGDPDLLTVKALRLMREADVVVLDRLVSEEIQDLIPAGTSRIFAGKEAGRHHLRQEEINDLLLRLAHSGRRGGRLKGGDPSSSAVAAKKPSMWPAITCRSKWFPALPLPPAAAPTRAFP